MQFKITVTPEPEQDRRYRMLLILNRSDRPRYWTFHCIQCTMPVMEIVNAEVQAISDVVDMNNLDFIGNGTRCDGRYQNGKCGIWYYTTLNVG